MSNPEHLLYDEVTVKAAVTWMCSRETGQVPRSAFPLDSTSAITAFPRTYRELER